MNKVVTAKLSCWPLFKVLHCVVDGFGLSIGLMMSETGTMIDFISLQMVDRLDNNHMGKWNANTIYLLKLLMVNNSNDK